MEARKLLQGLGVLQEGSTVGHLVPGGLRQAEIWSLGPCKGGLLHVSGCELSEDLGKLPKLTCLESARKLG